MRATTTQVRVRWTLLDTPFGALGLAWTDAGLRRLQLPEATRAATAKRLLAGLDAERLPARPKGGWIGGLATLLRRHLGGTPQDLRKVPLDLAGASPLARAVWTASRKVPAGWTTTYGELAQAIGRPGAARAVGAALGRNPVPLVVPCHRILGAGGRLCGFSAHGGVATKRRLLALEGFEVPAGRG
jgi:O-6-methylguanine DNA methyltransferase